MAVLIWGAAVCILSLSWRYLRISSSNSVPPGPKPLPFGLGNLLDLTSDQLWLRATDWAKQYGDIVYIHIFGQGIVFINTAEVAAELLDKRGAIYSDKPNLVMCGELCGCQDMVAFTRYSDQMKRQRKLLQGALGSPSVPQYHPLLEIETSRLLARLLRSPDDYIAHMRQYAGSLTLLVVYGYQVKSNNDPFLLLADHCVDLLSNKICSGGGIWPVDIFPSLRYLPEWAPGSGFLKKAKAWRAKMIEFVDEPFEYVKHCINNGTAVPSFCSTLLADGRAPVSDSVDFDIKWTANSMYSASIDTTMTVVLQFLLAMVQNPDVLAKAQKEIDTVVGNDRLPNFDDRLHLPYVECVMTESLRWGVPVPLSLPHRLMQDDVINGTVIPKGSLVFANVWNILRDESLFDEPDKFNPDRYLETVDEMTARRRNPKNFVFGFGRRICPGRHLTNSSLWILIASMIATLNISKTVDDKGCVIEPEVIFENAIFRMPSPFKLDIKPRSEAAVRIIKQAAKND